MSTGFPDGQRITQWLGAPVAQQTAAAIGAGLITEGPFSLGSWASVIVAVKPTGGTVTVTVKQKVPGGPAALELVSTFIAQPGAIQFQAIVLLGGAVTITLQGSAGGETLDYSIYPANTTTGTVGTGGTGAGVTGDIVWSAAPTRLGAVLCDGTQYDGTQAAFAALWGAIGLTYGGAGIAAFAVPDLRDRVSIGASAHSARGVNEGVAFANRFQTRHRHTPHVHAINYVSTAGGPLINPGGGYGNAAGTGAADGGSGVAADPLDGPAYLALNPFILL